MMKNQKYKISNDGFRNSDAVMERGMLLPLHHGLTKSMIDRLHNTINQFISGFEK
jgi:CDP-6-deoxy-D-xylo-4-hexulose-3-dehydrase